MACWTVTPPRRRASPITHWAGPVRRCALRHPKPRQNERSENNVALKHLNPTPSLPARTVIIGASGFVGGAIARLITEKGGQVIPLSRDDVDLLAPDAAARLSSFLKPGDAVVAAA